MKLIFWGKVKGGEGGRGRKRRGGGLRTLRKYVEKGLKKKKNNKT